VTRDASPEIVAAYGAEIVAVSAILLQHDPIGIGYGPDEYDGEARTIVARLATSDQPPALDDVLTIVHEEFIAWFDETISGPRDKYAVVARDVLAFWIGRSHV
jgi:hypothetical protein